MDEKRRFVRMEFDDRRRFVRFSITLKAVIEIEVDGETPSQAKILEFSRDGLRLFIPKDNIFNKESLKLKVYLPHKAAPVSLEGCVKWMKQGEDGWELGAKIENANTEEKSEILEYAYKIWKEKNI